MITATFAVLVMAAAGFSYRLLRGPAVADRLIGLEGLVLVGLAAIAVQAMATGSGAFLPVLVVLTLVGFVGTAAAARFIERPDDQGGAP